VQKARAALPAWLQSPDVQIPLALAIAVGLALGMWQCARSQRADRGGAGVATVVARPPAPPATASSPSIPAGPLGAAVAERLARKLGETPPGSPAWVAAFTDDAEAIGRAEHLHAILARTGWKVRPLVRTPTRNRPGYFLFAADENPPAYVFALSTALEEAGIKATFALGYRAFYEEMSRTRPNWVGFPFEPDQTFLLVVGRAP
jgi:hypothetical protein